MTLVNPQGQILIQAKGKVSGKIIETQKGTNGFGYDPIFEVDGYNMTMAQMSECEKNKISHRANALKEILEYLK